jgi:hypothetical protein
VPLVAFARPALWPPFAEINFIDFWPSAIAPKPRPWRRCPAGQRGARACADIDGSSPISKHTSPFTRAVPPRGLTMHVSRSPRSSKGYRPGHGTVPQLVMTASRQPVRHRSVPRSVVFPAQLRSFCVQGPWPFGVNDPAGGWQVRLRAFARNRRDRRSRSAPGLLCLTGTPGPFSARRRTIFCTGPMAERCVVSPSPAPVPPRRIAMRCSRCGTKRLSHGGRGRGKMRVSR